MSKRIMFWFNIQSFLFSFTSLWDFTWSVSDCEELIGSYLESCLTMRN